MNLALEKGVRVASGDEGRDEIRGKAGEVTAWLRMAWEKGMDHLVDGDSNWKSGGIAGS